MNIEKNENIMDNNSAVIFDLQDKNTFDGVYFTDEQLEEIRNSSIKDNVYPIVYTYDENKIYQNEFNAQKDPRGSLIMRI